MSPATIFQIHLVLGYVPWLLCLGAYVWPRLKSMDQIEAQRVDYLRVGSTGVSEPVSAVEPRLGRRTVLTFPLLPPPQKN
jgi:hypothetical protein